MRVILVLCHRVLGLAICSAAIADERYDDHPPKERFMLEIGDFRGGQQDFQLLFEHNTFKHVGFGLGINTVDSNIRARDEEIRGEFDSRMLSLLGYVKFYL